MPKIIHNNTGKEVFKKNSEFKLSSQIQYAYSHLLYAKYLFTCLTLHYLLQLHLFFLKHN